MQQLADLDLQSVPAFLNAIENIVLHARAVHFQKVPQKFSSIVRDYLASTHKRQKDVGEPAQRGWRLRNSDEVLESEPGTYAETLLRIERMGHPRQLIKACIRQPSQKVVSHLHKSNGHGAILALALFLLQSVHDHDRAVRVLEHALSIRAQHPAMEDGVAALAHDDEAGLDGLCPVDDLEGS